MVAYRGADRWRGDPGRPRSLPREGIARPRPSSHHDPGGGGENLQPPSAGHFELELDRTRERHRGGGGEIHGLQEAAALPIRTSASRAHPIHATGSPTQPDRPTPNPQKPLRLHLPLTLFSIFELRTVPTPTPNHSHLLSPVGQVEAPRAARRAGGSDRPQHAVRPVPGHRTLRHRPDEKVRDGDQAAQRHLTGGRRLDQVRPDRGHV